MFIFTAANEKKNSLEQQEQEERRDGKVSERDIRTVLLY